MAAVVMLAVMLPANAQQRLALDVLPPPEYGHPYKGTLVVRTMGSTDEVRQICKGESPFRCAFRSVDGNACTVILAPAAATEARGFTVEIVKRHEIGHCIGWPNNHAGARQWPARVSQ
jgi:hypothetical protein